MSNDAKEKALEAAKDLVEKPKQTRDALKEQKQKVGVLQKAKDELKKLAKEFKTLSAKEKLQRIGGLVALVTLGWLIKKPKDAEELAKGQGEAKEGETLKETKAEQDYAKQKEEKPEEAEVDPKADEVISKQQSATNMYAIRYYKNEKGEKFDKPNALGRICMKEKAIPSVYIRKRSYELFKEGVGSFDFFKKNVTDKLVHESVKDPKERVRQAAVILSCCAVGRFQIVPTYHFKRMGWKTRGEEGLRDMWKYIRSTDRQISAFKAIVGPSWNRYKDVGLVAVSYYAGDGTARAYQKDPTSDRFTKKQYGGHGSIHAYAEKARGNFQKFKAEIPGLKDIDYAAMCLEANETGRGVIYARAKQGKGLSSMHIA